MMYMTRLPDEIVQHLLFYVSPEDTLGCFQFLCHRFHRLANAPLLWRYHCQSSFKYWSPDHDFRLKLSQRVSEVDWKRLYILRRSRNGQIARILDEILATKVGRLRRMEQICRFGYDAKDFLLEQCQAPVFAEDVLARRYHSNAILDSIHRSVAIETWYEIQLSLVEQSSSPPSNRLLEKALGAFDMFVLHDQPGDLDDISSLFDSLAAEFSQSRPDFMELPTRQKALALNRWLRANGLTGLQNPERNYRNLRNCLIGQALRHPDHDSIPIISSAIFCCLAERLSLHAQCCAFPTHVHAIVFSDPDKTLDGNRITNPSAPRERMYLDPYGSDDEVPMSSLQNLLSRFGWQTSTDVFLAPVSPVSVAMRTARNIKATSARVIELRDQANPELIRLISGDGLMNMDAALYSAFWASLILNPVSVFEWDENLEPFLRRFAKNWHEDAWLVEKYLCPLHERFAPLRDRFARHGARGWDDPWEIIGLVRELDDTVPTVSRRTGNGTQQLVSYKIGQVFRHKRYRWIGVINGWNDQDDNSDLELTSLVRPRNQTFYSCLRSIGPDSHVVAEDNIIVIDDPLQIPSNIFALAGKFFKRFDASTCSFVSNMKEQYPDD